MFNDKYHANDIYFPDANGQMNRIDFESLQSILTNIGAGYGRDIRDLPSGGLVVATHELCMNITSVASQLATPGGTLVIIGHPGVGRRTAVELSSYHLQMETFTPPISNLSEKTIKGFFRNVTSIAGNDDMNVCLLVEQHHLDSNTLVIEYINALLSQGYIHGLWSSEELDSLKPAASSSGQSVMELFKSRCMTRLRRVVICNKGCTCIMGSSKCPICIWSRAYSATRGKGSRTFEGPESS